MVQSTKDDPGYSIQGNSSPRSDRKTNKDQTLPTVLVAPPPRNRRATWPEQSRERAVGQQFPIRLACCTIIRFIGSVRNALNSAPASRASLFVLSMHRHFRTKCGDLFRESVTRFRPQTLNPLPQCCLRRDKQPRYLFVGHLLRQRSRS